MKRSIFQTILYLAYFLLVFTPNANAADQDSNTLTIFAASGITNAMEEITRLYEQQTGSKVLCNFDSSSRLARQIQAGAGVDIFISANNKWLDLLKSKNLIFAKNQKLIVSTNLVLVTPKDSELGEDTEFNFDFANNFRGSLAIGDYAHVPAGIYAKQAMENIGVFEMLKDKLALCTNVADALRFVEMGQCRAGIVYRSSAVSSDKVRIIATIPRDSYATVVFTAGICNPNNPAVMDFMDFVNSPDKSVLFEKHGFNSGPIKSVKTVEYAEFLNEDEWSVLKLSIKVASLCVVIISVPGIGIGWLLARTKFRGKMLLEALVHLPLIMPPVVTGYLALIVLGKRGIVGKFLYDSLGISLPFTWLAAVIASAIMGLPLLVRSVKLAVQLIDKRLENAAASLGAHPVKVFLTVTLPLALPGIISGLILAFARSLGEFGATATFAGNIPGKTRTLSLAIHSLTQIPSREDSVIKLVLISITISVLAILFSELISRKMLNRTGVIPHD